MLTTKFFCTLITIVVVERKLIEKCKTYLKKKKNMNFKNWFSFFSNCCFFFFFLAVQCVTSVGLVKFLSDLWIPQVTSPV